MDEKTINEAAAIMVMLKRGHVVVYEYDTKRNRLSVTGRFVSNAAMSILIYKYHLDAKVIKWMDGKKRLTYSWKRS